MNENLKLGRQEYQRKLKAGLIEKSVALNPIEKAKANPKSLRAAINAKCWDCCCGSRTEVTRCLSKDCPLWIQRPWKA